MIYTTLDSDEKIITQCKRWENVPSIAVDFEGEYISIVATANCYYTSGRSEKRMRIKIHRKDINTVCFK